MPQANLKRGGNLYDDGLDSIVIVNCLGDIPSGRTLDVSGLADNVNVVKAGHIIIADANGVCKPMPVNSAGTAYDTLPSNHNYVGVLKVSVTKADPRAAIMTIGQVNEAAMPFPPTSAMKTALSHIQFLYA